MTVPDHISLVEKPQSLPHPEKPKEPKQHAEIRRLATKVCRPVAQLQDRYMSPKMLSAFGVSRVVPLDFETGNVPEQLQPFLRPIGPHEMDQMLRRTGSWYLRPNFEDLSHPDAWRGDNFQDACWLLHLLKEHLIRSDSGCENCILRTSTEWKPFGNSNKYLRRSQKLSANWQVKNVLRYCTSTPDMSSREPLIVDPSKPHLICYLADETPLRRDRISTSELHAVVFVATIYYIEPKHHNHSLVPVTVLSCSGRQVRIVQGVVNFPETTVELRVSRIIDFEKDVLYNWREYMTLLGWAIGEPIGNTAE